MLRSSAITQGIQRSPNRAMLRAVGFNDKDFVKPIIGIANGAIVTEVIPKEKYNNQTRKSIPHLNVFLFGIILVLF